MCVYIYIAAYVCMKKPNVARLLHFCQSKPAAAMVLAGVPCGAESGLLRIHPGCWTRCHRSHPQRMPPYPWPSAQRSNPGWCPHSIRLAWWNQKDEPITCNLWQLVGLPVMKLNSLKSYSNLSNKWKESFHTTSTNGLGYDAAWAWLIPEDHPFCHHML